MKAMLLTEIGTIADSSEPLQLAERPRPVPSGGQVLIRVSTCGVCHTELDEIEGRAAPPRLPMIPGHEVVGRVAELGPSASHSGLRVGDRVGVGWIYSSSGGPDENISPEFRATGRDADGGYAEYMTAYAAYTYPIPDVFSDEEAAPLLCAGAIGFRALRLAQLEDGQPVGLTGFGGSAHLVLQLVSHRLPRSKVYVFARDPVEREFALSLGAHWAGDTAERCPEKLRSIIDTTPAWKPVVEALGNLAPGGRLVINAIRKRDGDKQCLLDLSYHEHLWLEREIKSVANITADDIRSFLVEAAAIPIKPRVETFALEHANRALRELKGGKVRGAKVLRIG